MLSRARRPRADQPNSAHWESHKETLRRLYLEENHPLKTVKEMMQQEYDFNATDKMYKYHFKRWKFRKNMIQREALKHEADTVAGRGVVLPLAHGRELGSQRLKMRIMKLNGPDLFKPAQRALRMVEEHSQQRLKSWDLPNYRPGNTATESWAAVACLAAYAISTRTRAEGNYKALAKAATGFGAILQRQEPILVWSICTVILQLFEVMPDVAIGFIKVVSSFCINQLQENDPLRALWAVVLRTSRNNIPLLIAQITEAQIDFLQEEIGATNLFVLKYIKSATECLHDNRLITPYQAHARIDLLISELDMKLRKSGSNNKASTKNLIISANISKACIYLDHKQWDKVVQILEGIKPEVQANNGIDPASVVKYYEVKAEMLMERGDSERGDYFLSEQYYKMALAIAQQRLYNTMPGCMGKCLLVLVKYYERVRNTEKLEEFQAQYDQHLKRVAHDIVSGTTDHGSDVLSYIMDHFPESLSNPMEKVSDVMSYFQTLLHEVSSARRRIH